MRNDARAHASNHARSLELLEQVQQLDPKDGDVLFNIGMCQKELKDFKGASDTFKTYTDRFPGHPDGWAGLADSRFHLNEFNEALALADRALQLAPASVPAWTVRANCQRAIGQIENALGSFTQAIQLAPNDAQLRVQRGDTLDSIGSMEQAAADFKAALALVPSDGPTLKKATLCLLELDRGDEGIQLCRDILKSTRRT